MRRGPGANRGMDWRRRIADEFDRLAPSWDARHGPASLRGTALRMRTAWLRDLCRGYPRPRLLDVGCGTGQQLLALAGDLEQGVGIDVSSAMIERAHRNAGEGPHADRLRFYALAAEEMCPERLGTFDVVLFGASLEHMAEVPAPLARAAGVLRPGGVVILVLVHPWHPRGLWARLVAEAGAMPGLRAVMPGALRRAAVATGLRPIDPFGSKCLRAVGWTRRLGHRAWHGLLAPAAFGSYVAVFSGSAQQ